MKSMKTGGEALVQGLLSHGIDTIFGLPGVQNDHFYNAVFDAGDQIRHIHSRHEQGAAYMALGYALASGKPGVYVVVPGPGFLNTTAALSTAYALNAPVLCLTGQIHSDQLGLGFGMLHEIPDQLGILRSLTKWARRVESPAELPRLLSLALSEMHSDRPRPVGLEVPMDVLAGNAEIDDCPVPLTVRRPVLDNCAIEEASQLLAKARNPIIFVGGGAKHAGNEVPRLGRSPSGAGPRQRQRAGYPLRPPPFESHLRTRYTPMGAGRCSHSHRHSSDQTLDRVEEHRPSQTNTRRYCAARHEPANACSRYNRSRLQGRPTGAAANLGAAQPPSAFPHGRDAGSARGDGRAL